MSSDDSEETQRRDPRDYFCLDPLMPSSAVWVSCKRNKRDYMDGDTEGRKIVAPSKACNDLRTLVETVGEDNVDAKPAVFFTKSEQVINSCKPEKTYCCPVSSRLEKVVKPFTRKESKFEMEPESGKSENGNKRRLSVPTMQRIETDARTEDCRTFISAIACLDDCTPCRDENDNYGDGSTEKEGSGVCVGKDPTTNSYVSCEEDKSCGKVSSSEGGRLISELELISFNIKDNMGKEYPINVKYVWETDGSDVVNAAAHLVNNNQDLMSVIDNFSSLGLKSNLTLAESQKDLAESNPKSKSNTEKHNKTGGRLTNDSTDSSSGRLDGSQTKRNPGQDKVTPEEKKDFSSKYRKPEIKFTFKRNKGPTGETSPENQESNKDSQEPEGATTLHNFDQGARNREGARTENRKQSAPTISRPVTENRIRPKTYNRNSEENRSPPSARPPTAPNRLGFTQRGKSLAEENIPGESFKRRTFVRSTTHPKAVGRKFGWR